jgi:hypothetical protein
MAKALKCDGCRKVVAGTAYDEHDWYVLAKYEADSDDGETVAHMCTVDCLVGWAFARGVDVAPEVKTI